VQFHDADLVTEWVGVYDESPPPRLVSESYKQLAKPLLGPTQRSRQPLDESEAIDTIVRAPPDDTVLADLEALASTIRRSPDAVEAYVARSVVFSKLRDYPSAVKDLSEVLRIDPHSVIGLINRANAYGLMRRYEEALADLNRVLSLQLQTKHRAQACYLRGRTYCRMDRLDEAERDLDEALDHAPNHLPALRYRSWVRFGKEQYGLCIEDCTTLIALSTTPDVFWRRGASYAAIGRPDDALADLNQAIRLSPSMIRAFLSRAYVHQHAGRYQEAISDFSSAVALRPGYVTALNCRAECHLTFGFFELAIKDCNTALELEPDNAHALMIRARSLSATGKRNEALADLDRAIELANADPSLSAELQARRLRIYNSAQPS
jgi:tetratricopeptide (TPR) repeat protein